MKTVQISLNSIDKVKSFVNAITQFNFDFDLISGRYVIDAKSIMGILVWICPNRSTLQFMQVTQIWAKSWKH